MPAITTFCASPVPGLAASRGSSALWRLHPRAAGLGVLAAKPVERDGQPLSASRRGSLTPAPPWLFTSRASSGPAPLNSGSRAGSWRWTTRRDSARRLVITCDTLNAPPPPATQLRDHDAAKRELPASSAPPAGAAASSTASILALWRGRRLPARTTGRVRCLVVGISAPARRWQVTGCTGSLAEAGCLERRPLAASIQRALPPLPRTEDDRRIRRRLVPAMVSRRNAEWRSAAGRRWRR